MYEINVQSHVMSLAGTTPYLIDGTRNFIKFHFTLDESWDGLSVYAQFSQIQNGERVYFTRALEDGCCTLPSSIESGQLTLMVYGSGTDGTRGVSNYISFMVSHNICGDSSGSYDDPIPEIGGGFDQSVYDELTSNLNLIRNIVNQNTSDITVLKQDVSDLQDGLAQVRSDLNGIVETNLILDTEFGEVVPVGSVEWPIQELVIYGKSWQDGTPTPENPVEIESVAEPLVTVNDSGNNAQSTTIPFTLRGIPVTSGGNYTTSVGQQWIADEWRLNADGSSDLVQRLNEVVVKDTATFGNYWPTIVIFINDENVGTTLNATHYNFKSNIYNVVRASNSAGSGLGLFNLDSLYGTFDEAVEAFKSVDDFRILYVLAEEITTHYTPDETAVILRTYKPVTNIFNDQNAFMSVTYAADHKAYIDKKFAMLKQLIGG